ncbi:MAG: ATP synthase F1 subunit gamma [Nitrospira sp.]|nr:ATP synthase F1 subunit gamma [bacterium]MBL7048665.1 ATP synthase F1 subunit gamma [Nitrospira sp.]
MPTLSDIKRRINAVKNTRQITKAMKMVAASKLRKAQSRMLDMRPYADKMAQVIAGLSGDAEDLHPMLVQRPRNNIEVFVLTSDRGLCGAFNTNVMKAAERLILERRAESFNVSVCTVGKKAAEYFKRRNIKVRQAWTGMSGNLVYADVRKIAADIANHYMNEESDEVMIVYNTFRSVMIQDVTVAGLMPLAASEEQVKTDEPVPIYLYEPSQQAILDQLLPKNVEVQIYRALLESQASEEAARMTAMENATQNADEMIGTLTLDYNKARQATITRELMDIVGGVEALKD